MKRLERVSTIPSITSSIYLLLLLLFFSSSSYYHSIVVTARRNTTPLLPRSLLHRCFRRNHHHQHQQQCSTTTITTNKNHTPYQSILARGGNEDPNNNNNNNNNNNDVTNSMEEGGSTSTPPQPPTSIPQPLSTPPPTSTTFDLHTLRTTHPRLTNLIERTGPAIAMLSALYALVRYTGDKGLMGLVVVLQVGMYLESTAVVSSSSSSSSSSTTTQQKQKKRSLSDQIERWWWFATIFGATTLRSLNIGERWFGGGWSEEWWDLSVFGMGAVGLVGGVGRMAGMGKDGEDGVVGVRRYLGNWAGSNFSLIFLLGQSSYWIKTIQSFGPTWVLYPALLVSINDTMAYIFGVLFGKTKLIPRLSPKKTVEGFVGALLSTSIVSVPLFNLFLRKGWFRTVEAAATAAAATATSSSVEDNVTTAAAAAAAVLGKGVASSSIPNEVRCAAAVSSRFGRCGTRHALVVAAFASLVAPFGGFLASAVKRAHGAKDFGDLIPGHGGVIDRFDCQIVTAPFVFLYLRACMR